MEEQEIKIIKRYGNRKLYDTENSKYVTLDDIAQFVRDGVELKVLDNRTKEDLTAATLSQIIFEHERRSRQFPPLPALRRIIRDGGAAFEQLQRRFSSGIANIREEAETHLHRWLRVGEEARTWGFDSVKETLSSTRHSLEEMGERLDERISATTEMLPDAAWLLRELRDLTERVRSLQGVFQHLEDRVDGMVRDEAEAAKARPEAPGDPAPDGAEEQAAGEAEQTEAVADPPPNGDPVAKEQEAS